jgi:hypothetical protein
MRTLAAVPSTAAMNKSSQLCLTPRAQSVAEYPRILKRLPTRLPWAVDREGRADERVSKQRRAGAELCEDDVLVRQPTQCHARADQPSLAREKRGQPVRWVGAHAPTEGGQRELGRDIAVLHTSGS